MGTPIHPSGAKKISEAVASRPGGPTGDILLPPGVTADEMNRAFHLVAATATAFDDRGRSNYDTMTTPTMRRHQSMAYLHERDMSRAGPPQNAAGGHDEHQGGHDAPNWGRTKSYSVLVGCTMLYALIAGTLSNSRAYIEASLIIPPQKSLWTLSMSFLMDLVFPRNSSA